jgi:hypothetical protein
MSFDLEIEMTPDLGKLLLEAEIDERCSSSTRRCVGIFHYFDSAPALGQHCHCGERHVIAMVDGIPRVGHTPVCRCAACVRVSTSSVVVSTGASPVQFSTAEPPVVAPQRHCRHSMYPVATVIDRGVCAGCGHPVGAAHASGCFVASATSTSFAASPVEARASIEWHAPPPPLAVPALRPDGFTQSAVDAAKAVLLSVGARKAGK